MRRKHIRRCRNISGGFDVWVNLHGMKASKVSGEAITVKLSKIFVVKLKEKGEFAYAAA